MQQQMKWMRTVGFFAAFGLLLSSCYPPAGTTLLAEKTFTQHVNGFPVTITAAQERVVNKFYKGYRLKEVKVFYHVRFSLLLNEDTDIKNGMVVPISKGQSIDAVVNKFKLVFSPDTLAFAIGVGDSIFAMYHFLDKQTVFPSHTYYREEKKLNAAQGGIIPFDALDWGVFPSNASLFDSIILRIACSNALNGEVYHPLLRTALQTRPIGSATDFMLIEN